MVLQIYPSGMIGSEDECFKQAQNAQIEFAKCSAAVLDGSVPEFQVVGAPFLFRDSDHFWAVMNGEIGKSLLKKIDSLMGICYFDAGARSLYTTKKPVRSVEDMKGLKIRTQKSSIAMQSMEALGASPTPISWGELYTALSQGTVDAAENNIPSFVTGRHFEVCKYFIFTEHQRVPDVLVMSRKIWDGLSAEQQGWIEKAAAEANAFQREAWRKSEEVNEKIARDAGVEFITVDREPFMALSKPIYDAFPAELRELAERIREVK
jgi:tripartite ATP-independent transporter DctP family solute receptor